MDLTDEGSWETWVVHKELADQAFRQGLHSLAVAEYTQAINRCTGQPSDRAKLFANRGLACQRAGNWRQCLQDAMAAIQLDHSYVKGWFRLGTALAKMDFTPEALRAFTCALVLEPSNKELQEQRQIALDKQAMAQAKANVQEGEGVRRLRQEVQQCLSNAERAMCGQQPSYTNGHAATNGSGGPSAKSKNARKRDKAKAKAKAAGGSAQLGMQSSTSIDSAASDAAPQAPPGQAANAVPAFGHSQCESSLRSMSEDGAAAGPQSEACNGEVKDGSQQERQPPTSPYAPHHQQSQQQAQQEEPPAAPADPSEAQRAKGTALYQAGDWQGALAAYQAAAAMAPGVAANPANCAAAAMMLRQYKAAAEHACVAIGLDPSFLRAYLRAGKACLMMGRLDEAARHYAAAVKLGPVTPALRVEAAAVEGVCANLEAGNAALEADPRQAQWYAGLAERLSGPGLEPAQMLRCKALLRLGKHAEALAETRSLAVEGDAASVEVLAVRAEALYASGNMERAQRVYEEALRRDPDATACARGLKRVRALAAAKEAGNAAFKAQRWADAHASYSAVISRRSDDAAAEGNAAFYAQCYSNRSAVCMKLGRLQDALADAEAAVAADPAFVKGFLRLAAAHEALAQWEDAVRDYERVKEMDGEVPGIADMLRRAKVELKKSKRVDYYALLDVQKDCSEADIKKAYKRAALRYHPDKAASEERAEAEKKFKQVGAAVAILSDADKRRKYDAGWTDEEIEQGAPEGSYGGGGMGGGVPMDDLLAAMFAQQYGGGGFPGGGGGGFPRAGGHYARRPF